MIWHDMDVNSKLSCIQVSSGAQARDCTEVRSSKNRAMVDSPCCNRLADAATKINQRIVNLEPVPKLSSSSVDVSLDMTVFV
jgi:hypothetical protein